MGQEPGVTLSLAEFASLAVAEGQPERAARSWRRRNFFEQVGFLFSGANGLGFARSIARARAPSWTRPPAIRAWQEGEAMSREQAIAYALAPPAPG